MARLPLITGFGGINAAGLSSGHHGYRRIVSTALPEQDNAQMLATLATLTGIELDTAEQSLDGRKKAALGAKKDLLGRTLIRQLEDNLFDPQALHGHGRAHLAGGEDGALEFSLKAKHLPSPLPHGWTVVADDLPGKMVRVRAEHGVEAMLACQSCARVNSAGQLPSGFDPAALYASRNHPRGLQLTVFAASDAVNSLGMDWEQIRQRVPADQISVYAGSGMSQLDYNGYGGMLQARLLGKKVTSKQLPLGYAEMPADFVNAYLLGNLGTTGTNVAACATFLYNLRQGIRDIQQGSHRVVLVGTSEAPLTPEIFEGFATMGALVDDDALRRLDGLSAQQAPDYRRACRPFGNNAGFTLAESAQFIVLMDDELALETGANIFGAVNDVFINADGFKKSIASPGLGNYLSLAKAASATANVIGEEGLRRRSYVQAHGTGTPQNRTTESHIIDTIAKQFGIERWPVTAVKTYVGHSLASSAGDQLAASLGVWAHGIIPGITTIDGIADDVSCERAHFLLQHEHCEDMPEAVVINSKGFGGNNASASVLSPDVARAMLARRHGEGEITAYMKRNEAVAEQTRAYDEAMQAGENRTIYKFNHNVLDADAIRFEADAAHIDGLNVPVDLRVANPYKDMC